jgi:hypothetical protein
MVVDGVYGQILLNGLGPPRTGPAATYRRAGVRFGAAVSLPDRRSLRLRKISPTVGGSSCYAKGFLFVPYDSPDSRMAVNGSAPGPIRVVLR